MSLARTSEQPQQANPGIKVDDVDSAGETLSGIVEDASAHVRIDLTGFLEGKYDLPEAARVSDLVDEPGARWESMPGDGDETQLPDPMPPGSVEVAVGPCAHVVEEPGRLR
jgi:hypothetical protein